MKYYDRETEIAQLSFMKKRAFEDHSCMTVITGRRRIGKTTLMEEACKGEPTVYLFVTRDNEAVLCQNFIQNIAQGIGLIIPESVNRVRDIFRLLMEEGKNRPFNLIIDEFNDFKYVNPAIFSNVQEIWDKYHKQTHVNLLLGGSVYTLMQKIFRDSNEPLFGRADAMLRLRPFGTGTMKEIMADFNPGYTNDDLLALYCFTGGVPKYVKLLLENGAYTRDAMIDWMIQEDGLFIDEGKKILMEEFGKEYGTYFSILGTIASGQNTQPEIQAALGNKSAGGLLQRLIDDYGLLQRKRPVFSSEGSQTVRFEISDVFFRFWFRYLHKYRRLVEIRNFGLLRDTLKNDYATFSGQILEVYFRNKLMEKQQYRDIGGWWDPKGYIDNKGNHQQAELDIVAVDGADEILEIYEVKRNAAKYKQAVLKEKTEYFQRKEKMSRQYRLKLGKLSLEDM